MMKKNSLSQDITNNLLQIDDPIFKEIDAIVDENRSKLLRLNTTDLSKEEVRALLSDITGREIDASFSINLPFYTDFGRHIHIGRHVFINCGVTFTDLGGITLEDHVLIGPGASLISVNHPVDPALRRGIIVKPVLIKRNAWIGACAVVLPGITVGENAIVAANATVTRDVPPNTIVAGTPAKIIKEIPIE
ncbi:DapH/DapD/GlmU-related protein [Paenilisteria weihenstephanensis]